MRNQKWVIGALALAMAAGSALSVSVQAADGAGAAKTEKKAKGEKKNREGKGNKGARGPMMQQVKMLEKALGAPLTDQQKQDIEIAHKAYMEGVAKAVGLTPEQLQEKVKASREQDKVARGDKAKK